MKKLLLIAYILLISSVLNAAEYGGVTAAPYLNLGMGARPCGMGEAYTAAVDNVDAVWWNPGCLVKVENPQFSFMHNAAFGGTSYEYLSFAEPAEQLGLDLWGTIGITAMLLRLEDIPQTKEIYGPGSGPYGDYASDYAQEGEVYSAGGTMVGIAYSWQAAKMISIGATIKMINQKVALEEGWIPAMDIGILAKTNVEGFDVGVVGQNISFMDLNGAPLPLNLKFGVSYKLPRLFTSETDPKDRLTFALDGVLPIVPANMPFKLHVGLEYSGNISGIDVTMRSGYRFNGNQFISDLGSFAGCTFGGGFGKNFDGVDVSLDYAFIPYGILGDTHRMGMTIDIGEPTPTPTPVLVKPPKIVKLSPKAKKIVVTWSVENKDKLKGYNVYMSYKPGGKYYKLTKQVLNRYYLIVGPLKSGLRTYFVVTAVDKNGKESKYSREISAVPR